jgi:hypothetical protein
MATDMRFTIEDRIGPNLRAHLKNVSHNIVAHILKALSLNEKQRKRVMN